MRRLLAFLLLTVACSVDSVTSAPGSFRRASPSLTNVTGGAANRLGVNVQSWGNFEFMLDSLAAADVGWVRVATVWGEASSLVTDTVTARRATQRGMYVLGGVNEFVPFAYRVRDDCSLPSIYHMSQWRAYVDSVVTAQAATGVRHFSVSNEPNVNCGLDWINHYWPALVEAASVIHAKDPSYKVVGFELGSGSPQWELQRIGDLLANNPGVVDIMAVHVYQPAYYVAATVNQMYPAISAVSEVWLTEFGNQENATALEDRDELAHFLQFWLRPYEITNPLWTKSFMYRLGGAPNHGSLFTCDAGWNCAPTLKYQALRYMQARARFQTHGVGYGAFSHAYQTWFPAVDYQVTPPGSYGFHPDGMWGMQMDFAGLLKRAGVRLCARYHVGHIGWIGWYCEGEAPWEGWFPWQTAPKPFEAFQIRMEQPLPRLSYTLHHEYQSLCADAWPLNSTMRSGCSSNGQDSPVIGTTGQARPLLRFRMNLLGDIR